VAKVLISAGEASGDLYAAGLVQALRRQHPELEFFGCAGPRMRAAGVEAVVASESLAVVGLVEVVTHIPRIYGEYRKLLRAARNRRPDVAILTDSPDFHLRVAKQLKRMGIRVVYLVAPQVWAWRRGRVRVMRRSIDRLLCIFPFEREFFAAHGIPVRYIGHPLTRLARPAAPLSELRARLGVPDDATVLALLPGSREGEIERHLPFLTSAEQMVRSNVESSGRKLCSILALPPGMGSKFRERFSGSSIQVQEGQTWDVLACSDAALAASGTVTIEACLLGAPMVTFYRVNGLSWLLGKLLVRVPFYSMVNLVAGRQIVPELIQRDMTAQRLAGEACSLLHDDDARRRMKMDLAEAAARLRGSDDPTASRPGDPMAVAASEVMEFLDKELVHVS
jgi:lipid-A-disaccharide synthase